MIKLLIADDHAILRNGLKQLFMLETDIEVAGEASHGAEVLNLVKDQQFDLLLLDMTMNGLSGSELIKEVKAINANLPILMLSMHRVSEMAIIALKAGANGYITKDSETEDLVAAIRKVAAGGKYIDSFLADDIVSIATGPVKTKPHIRLSSREHQVFLMLVSGKNANEIGQKLSLNTKTVSTYKSRIMEKMDIHNIPDLVRYALQYGLI